MLIIVLIKLIVAKYLLVAVVIVWISNGETKFISSGFFWTSFLYCRHTSIPF